MNKELREMLQNIQNKKNEARELLKNKKVDEAEAMTVEIKAMEKEYAVALNLFEDEKEGIEMKNKGEGKEVKNIQVEAFKNFVTRQPMTPEMQNAMTSTADGAALVPTEFVKVIQSKKEQLVQLKNFVQVIPVTAPSGTVPVDSSVNNGLTDFDEDTDIAQGNPTFTNISYAVKNKGKISAVSNILAKDSAFGVPALVVDAFVKAAVKSENLEIIAQLKAFAGAAKQLADVDAFRKSINKDLDPAVLATSVIIMNQDAYEKMDSLKGTDGHGILNPSLSNPNVKTFKGLPIVVLSNSELPTTGTTTKKAPIFYGDLKSVIFFDLEQYQIAVSEHAGFNRNNTLMRIIERFDVKGAVGDYIYAEFDVTDIA